LGSTVTDLKALIENVVVNCATAACDKFELRSNSSLNIKSAAKLDTGVALLLLEKATARGQSGEFSFLTQAFETTTLNGVTVNAGWKAWLDVIDNKTAATQSIANIIGAIANEQVNVSQSALRKDTSPLA
jgi:hypothetical protein